MNPNKTNTLLLCEHCGDPCNRQGVHIGDKVFCCEGCKSVYAILHDYDLCEYYTLNNHPGITQKQHIRKDKFAFLDIEDIAAKLIQFKDDNQTHVTF